MAKRKYIRKPQIYTDGLVDIRDIHIDVALPVEEKLKSYIEQIKNPYGYRVGDIVVNIRFADTNRTFTEARLRYLSSITAEKGMVFFYTQAVET